MNRLTSFLGSVLVCLLTLLGPAGRAQSMPGGDAGFNSLVTKMFRHIPTFSAAVETTMTNKSDRSRITIPMKMAKLDDQLRIEVDLGKVRGAGMSLQALNALENVGMSKMVNFMKKGTNAMVVYFPQLKFHTRVAMPDTELTDAEVKITKKAAGRDLVNGYTCTKQNVVVTMPSGAATRLVTWEAADLKGFPVRILVEDETSTVVMNYREVKLVEPPAEQFQLPPDARAFDSLPNLMEVATSQAMRNTP